VRLFPALNVGRIKMKNRSKLREKASVSYFIPATVSNIAVPVLFVLSHYLFECYIVRLKGLILNQNDI
jgi:hypothetical protein